MPVVVSRIHSDAGVEGIGRMRDDMRLKYRV